MKQPYQFVNEITQAQAVGVSGTEIGALKAPGEIVTTHATITNLGNMPLTVDITVQHHEMVSGTARSERIGVNNVTIPVGGSYAFNGPGQAIDETWLVGNYGTTIKVYDAGTANVITGGVSMQINTFVLSAVYQVVITGLTVT